MGSATSGSGGTSQFTLRVISAVFIVLTIVFGVLFNVHAMLILFGVINLFCLIEYQQIVNKLPDYRVVNPVGETTFLCIIGMSIYAIITGVSLGYFLPRMLFFVVLLFQFFFIKTVFEHTKGRNGLLYLASSLLGVIWFSIPLALFVPLAMVTGTFKPWIVMGVIILVWLSDTGAYFSGKRFGKTPLYKSISPSKTREGSFGALITVLLVAVLLHQLIGEMALIHWLVVAVLISFFGTIGDLVESLLKRSVDVKDSGGLLPGHGGFLDRFDAMVFCMPFVYAYIYFVMNCI